MARNVSNHIDDSEYFDTNKKTDFPNNSNQIP